MSISADIAPSLGHDGASIEGPERAVELPKDLAMLAGATISASYDAAVAVGQDVPNAGHRPSGLQLYAEHLGAVVEGTAAAKGLNIGSVGIADLESLTAAIGVLNNMECCHASLAELGDMGLAASHAALETRVEAMLGA